MAILRETAVKDIMNSKVITIQVDEPFSHVFEKMQRYCIRHLPVVDTQQALVGIITLWDFYRAYHPHMTADGEAYDKEEMDRLILKHRMTKNPTTVKPDHKVVDAANILATDKFGSLPVLNTDGKLVGIVTHIDILRFVAQRLI